MVFRRLVVYPSLVSQSLKTPRLVKYYLVLFFCVLTSLESDFDFVNFLVRFCVSVQNILYLFLFLLRERFLLLFCFWIEQSIFYSLVPSSETLSVGYVVRDGLLMHKWTPLIASATDDWSAVTQIVVPAPYRVEVLNPRMIISSPGIKMQIAKFLLTWFKP